MSLIDRVANIRDPEDPEALNRIPVLSLVVGFRALALGEFSVAEFKSFLDLDAGEQAEIDYLVAKYTALSTAEARSAFIDYLEILFVLAELQVPGYTTRQAIQDKIDAY